ncbi:MAG: hypothetical protein LQ341_004558 [Variospora aurantia]|nr:MAG: hypothetical protein LQ341_004558 [Variospora aurantia]
MVTVRKYATLPDLVRDAHQLGSAKADIRLQDAAPDIYETPELTDDASTAVASSTIRSDSRASSAASLDGEESAINRQRIDPNEARNNFSTTDDSEKASRGWIGTKRAGYKASGRRIPHGSLQHALPDSSDDDEESLERKLARLRQEVAEVKESFARRSGRAKLQDVAKRDEDSEPLKTLDSLNHALDSIETSPTLVEDDSSSLMFKRLDELSQLGASQIVPQPAEGAHTKNHTNHEPDPTLDHGEAHILSRVSDFDKRLRMLETALGMDTIPLPTQDRSASRAVLPVLDGLYRQISTLSMTETSLDKVSRQIRQMTQDSERLVEARKAAAVHRSSNQSTSERNRLASAKLTNRSTEDKEDLDKASKINALYGTLSTIESLSPLLPSVLDRLQSLRVIHADAALASEALSHVESRQAAMSEELKEWNDGLGKVESAMKLGETSMKENAAVVDGWVKDLERRLQTTKSASSI